MAGKLYQVTFPDGGVEQIINLKEFCEKYGLDAGHMSRVANGTRSHHKGFLVKIIDANDNTVVENYKRKKNEKILDACKEFVQTPYSQLSSKQIENLVITLFAIEKAFGELK